MADKKKSDAKKPNQQELQLKYRLRNKRIDAAGTIVSTFIKWASLAFVAYCVRDAVVALSGKLTLAQIGVNVLGNVKVSESLELVVSVTAVIYGLGERKLRHTKTEYLAGRLKKYETELDRGRSSSHLTPKGTTRPEDAE